MRLVKVLIAFPMILLFGILRLFATAISWLYCRAASLLFIPMIILLILSVIATQWLAVGIIGAAVAICFILLFTIGWIEVGASVRTGVFQGAFAWIIRKLPMIYLRITYELPVSYPSVPFSSYF